MRLGAQFLARLCRLPKQEFKIPNSSAVRHVRYANIVQAVKRCYKIKIDYRDFCCCFCGVLLRY